MKRGSIAAVHQDTPSVITNYHTTSISTLTKKKQWNSYVSIAQSKNIPVWHNNSKYNAAVSVLIICTAV